MGAPSRCFRWTRPTQFGTVTFGLKALHGLSWACVCNHQWLTRPLRTFSRLFGLDHLTFRELRQLGCGTAFFLQTALALTYQLVHGGYAVSEHPGTPWDPALPSIWRSAILQLLMKHPQVRLHTVRQWRWGASVKKPTGLMAVRLHGFANSMYRRATEGISPPKEVAIGKDEKGAFRTAAHKEYPPDFCKAIAGSLTDQLERDRIAGRYHVQVPSEALEQWLGEAMKATSQAATSAFLPDYQGH